MKNTVPDNYNLAVDQSKFPRSLLCESAKNGETVDGVSVVECQNSSSGSSKEFRCVHYNGVLDSSVEVGIRNASGEGIFLNEKEKKPTHTGTHAHTQTSKSKTTKIKNKIKQISNKQNNTKSK